MLPNQNNSYGEFESAKKKVKNRNYVLIRQKRLRDTNTLSFAMKIKSSTDQIKTNQVKFVLRSKI